MSARRAVCITGLGVVSPNGVGVDAFLAGLRAGRSGIRPLATGFSERLAHNAFGVVELPEECAGVPRARAAGLDRVCVLALVAAHEAVNSAALAGHPAIARAHLAVGTGMGGAESLEQGYQELLCGNGRLNPFIVLKTMSNAAAAHIALDFGCRGRSLTYSTACSSSAIAIGEAAAAIGQGTADLAIAGGSEALLRYGTICAWQALRTLAVPDPEDPATACRPFAADRTGLVLAEGAAFVVLEEESHARARGAPVLARLSGYGAGTDSTHLTRPSPAGQAAAMRAALQDAGLRPEQIGYVNAHGTATLAGDAAETQAIKDVFGAHAPALLISSTKSMHGHVMGATGAVELVACVLSLRHGFVPPTINLHKPDPACDLDYVPNVARPVAGLEHVMSNSFAFGGSNAVLVASRAAA